MKLSEFSTDKAADVLCEISVYALNIVSDEELRGSLKKLKAADSRREVRNRRAAHRPVDPADPEKA